MVHPQMELSVTNGPGAQGPHTEKKRMPGHDMDDG